MAEALAAIVSKADSEAVLAALREDGVYDPDRSVREHGADTLAIPVTERPTGVDVQRVIEEDDPDVRTRGLADVLRDRGFDEAAIERAPSSWAVLGTVVLADFEGCDREAAVGEALLDLHGGADTVLAREGVTGVEREPSVRVVAGEGDTETVHREHGIEYAMDLSRVMFSPGNKAERSRMGEVVAPADRVFDMFAGIGYFALPMAEAGATVTATEINPTAFRYLLENAVANGLEDRLAAYREDCRTVAERVGTADPFDRIVMGHYDAPEYLEAALPALAGGGTVHLHAAVPEAELWERPVDALETAAAGARRPVQVLERRRVKTHSEGVWHVAVDARVA